MHNVIYTAKYVSGSRTVYQRIACQVKGIGITTGKIERLIFVGVRE